MILSSNKRGEEIMNNIIFENIWRDDNLIELKITCISEYVTAYQTCYIENKELHIIGERISQYSFEHTKGCYLEFGKKEGNFTPAFSMKLLPADSLGHVKVEVDVEIFDNDKREHRCCFYVFTELGLIDDLGMTIRNIGNGNNRTICSLNPNY